MDRDLAQVLIDLMKEMVNILERLVPEPEAKPVPEKSPAKPKK